jgi:hypothetical protein
MKAVLGRVKMAAGNGGTKTSPIRALGILGLIAISMSACGSKQIPEPTLPAGAKTLSFVHNSESFLRGVQGSYNTSPRGRPAAILDVNFKLVCLADGGQARFRKASKILSQKNVVSPLYFDNPREHREWREDASRAVAETGCLVDGLTYSKQTEDPMKTLMWALRNKVPPAR